MHWYFMLFHGPTFRTRLEAVLSTGLVSSYQRPFVLLILVVLILGARFLDTEEKERTCSGIDLDRLQKSLIAAAERWFLPSTEELDTDFFAFGFLLATNYFYARQLRAATLTLGITVRAAQSFRLHQESSWGHISDTERQYRRRVWACLFIGAG
jgi:hypothetical protein